MQAAATEQEQAELDLQVDLQAGRPEAADQAQIRTLITQHLADGLQLFSEENLDLALHDFVDKASLELADAVPALSDNVSAQHQADGLQLFSEENLDLALHSFVDKASLRAQSRECLICYLQV